MVVLYGPRVSLEKFKEVDEGGDVTVECKYKANPEPVSVFWARPDQPRFRQSGRFLHLRNVSYHHGGDYACVVTNKLDPSGDLSRERRGNASVTLAVRHRPGPGHIQPSDPVGIEGKAVTLSCGASPGGYPLPSFTWWKDSKPSEILSTSKELTIRPVRMSHEGKYFCQPHNNYGKGPPVSVQLTVVQEPRIVSGLTNQVVRKEGDSNLNLTCLGVGKPRPSATWFKDGLEIAGDDYFKIKTSEDQDRVTDAVTVTSTLVFFGSGRVHGDQVRPWDSGEFTCQFDNSVGRAQSAMALKVEHAPLTARAHLDKVAADLGERAEVTCRMKAFPAPVFTWEKGGVPISDSSVRRNSRSIRQISDYEYESVFTIWSVKGDSYGDYVCKASNTMGAEETIVKLVRKGKPESPSDLMAKETGSNNIILAWTENFNGGMNNTSFKLEWMQQGTDYAQEKWCQGGESLCLLDSLEQHTTYLVRVKAVNKHGESDWSDQVSVTTQIDVSQIPTPESIFFEKSSKTTSFKVSTYPLNLMAKLEVMRTDGSWTHLRSVSLRNKPYKFIVNPKHGFESVRVRICLESNDVLCGPYNEASTVDKIQEPQLFIEGGQSWLLAIIIVALVCTIVIIIVAVKCCCRQGPAPKRKYLKKEDELHATRPDILHPSLSFDQKMTSLDLMTSPSTDLYNQQTPAQGNGQYCEQSSDGSGNRASVNSQDSLWHVKDGEQGGAGQQADHGSYVGGYDPAGQDYAHYPRPEEYMVGQSMVAEQASKLWQYTLACNGDQYAVPNKIKTQSIDQTINGKNHSSVSDTTCILTCDDNIYSIL